MQRNSTFLWSAPRPIDPALPSDGGAGGITTPEGKEPEEDEEPREEDDLEDNQVIEVGDPRDGP